MMNRFLTMKMATIIIISILKEANTLFITGRKVL